MFIQKEISLQSNIIKQPVLKITSFKTIQSNIFVSFQSSQSFIKIFCSQCKKPLNSTIYIASQSDQYCIGCYANNDCLNDYQIKEKHNFLLFQEGWTASDQILLLDCILKFGFGNWTQVKEYMHYFGAFFTENQIQTHYNTFYLRDKSFQPKFSDKIQQEKKDYQLNFNGGVQISVASLKTTHPQDSLNEQFEQNLSQNQPLSSTKQVKILPQRRNIMAYNQLRKQFDVDYDQNAQKKLANLQFREDDLPQQTQIKFKLLQQYNQRISVRQKVSSFVIQHKLLDVQYQAQLKKSMSKYQSLAHQELKPFMQYTQFSHYNKLVRHLALDKQLKSVIQGMRSFRKTCETGKLKQVYQELKQNSQDKMMKRAKPRKIIHLDNMDNNTQLKNRNQQELVNRLGIKITDVQNIVKESKHKQIGDKFKYQHVDVILIEKN